MAPPFMRPFESEYDFIVVGAGSAGCVIANRLSADPAARVALVEAGGPDDWRSIHVPAGTRHVVGDPATDWCYMGEPEPVLGRAMPVARGKVLGGSSSINGTVYVRGAISDYERWRGMGLEEWGWEDVLPLFKRSERHVDGGDEMHGGSGELSVEHPRLGMRAFEYLTRAANEAGVPYRADFNRGVVEGCGMFDVTQRRGVRQSTARAFLHPVRRRRNLQVITNARCLRVLLDGARATGIEVRQGERQRNLAAKCEVILSAGVVGSPQLLQLSGIGPPHVLQQAGVAVRHALAGVGTNLQDHMTLRITVRVQGVSTVNTRYHNLLKRALMALEYAALGSGPLVMGAPLWGGYARSDPGRPEANVQFFSMPASMSTAFGELDRFDAIAGGIYNMHPRSRGRVWIKSADPLAAPAILHNYLVDDDDRRVAIDSIRLMRRIYAAPSFQALHPQEIRPGPGAQSDEDILAAGIQSAGTAWHQVGTCAMGLGGGAVVDPRLRVHGIGGLRIADGSVMPDLISGNTNAPIIMIGEKAADMIRRDRR